MLKEAFCISLHVTSFVVNSEHHFAFPKFFPAVELLYVQVASLSQVYCIIASSSHRA